MRAPSQSPSWIASCMMPAMLRQRFSSSLSLFTSADKVIIESWFISSSSSVSVISNSHGCRGSGRCRTRSPRPPTVARQPIRPCSAHTFLSSPKYLMIALRMTYDIEVSSIFASSWIISAVRLSRRNAMSTVFFGFIAQPYPKG